MSDLVSTRDDRGLGVWRFLAVGLVLGAGFLAATVVVLAWWGIAAIFAGGGRP